MEYLTSIYFKIIEIKKIIHSCEIILNYVNTIIVLNIALLSLCVYNRQVMIIVIYATIASIIFDQISNTIVKN